MKFPFSFFFSHFWEERNTEQTVYVFWKSPDIYHMHTDTDRRAGLTLPHYGAMVRPRIPTLQYLRATTALSNSKIF